MSFIMTSQLSAVFNGEVYTSKGGWKAWLLRYA
jgi:hypothetical protein